MLVMRRKRLEDVNSSGEAFAQEKTESSGIWGTVVTIIGIIIFVLFVVLCFYHPSSCLILWLIGHH
jgi:hypothetical protein